jgi:subtilisin-like proprotein convertase family protein/Ca2+-binding EF-hand superfamily protein
MQEIIQRFSSMILAVGLVCVCSQSVFAQAGLRESLERLDTNENGLIEPDEITPLSRPYLERIAEVRRMSLDRPNGIDTFQEAARIYYAKQNGVASDEVRPERTGALRTFGTSRHEPMLAEFGIGEVKYQYTLDDLDEADGQLRRYDRDRDGTIDRDEARRAEWTYRDPFADDLNKDDRLSRLELAQRYARRRTLSSQSSELIQKARRAGNGIAPSRSSTSESSDRDQWWRRGGSSQYLAYSILGRFDKDRNGRLDRAEFTELGMPIAEIDIDRNGEITRDEMSQYVSRMQQEVGGGEEGIPGWFYERDLDRDGQVSLAEFSPELTVETMAEFNALDANQDGLLTKPELSETRAVMGGEYVSTDAVPLPPGQTVISEIEVSENFLVADLNVRISITHTQTGHLDAYLTGPNGERIELFTEVGGHDDNFDNTIFDDQASNPIVKGRPPFEGSYLPEGLLKNQPGLSVYNGKSIEGVWQLVIRGTRSDRFGILHGWSLQARPLEQ